MVSGEDAIVLNALELATSTATSPGRSTPSRYASG